MNYAEQSDKLAGPIALLKKCVRCLARPVCSHANQLPYVGSFRVQVAKLPKMRHRCLVDGGLPWVEWERLSRMCVGWSRYRFASSDLTVDPQFHRTSPFDAILAGAEDVLGDLGVRQAIRKIPKDARL